VSFAVAAGLLAGGAGGATAVADPGSHGSTGHDHSGAGPSNQRSTSVTSGAGSLQKTVQGLASAFDSGRNPSPQYSSGANTQIVLHGNDNKTNKQNAGFVPVVPKVVDPIPNLGAPVTKVVTSGLLPPVQHPSATDPDFVTQTTNFGLFTITAAADPDDNEYVATVISTPFGTDVLTSGTDPSGSLGYGQAGVGVSGETVNTLITAHSQHSFAIPFTDPFAPLFTLFIPLGF
jgi:hypothetical protein